MVLGEGFRSLGSAVPRSGFRLRTPVRLRLAHAHKTGSSSTRTRFRQLMMSKGGGSGIRRGLSLPRLGCASLGISPTDSRSATPRSRPQTGSSSTRTRFRQLMMSKGGGFGIRRGLSLPRLGCASLGILPTDSHSATPRSRPQNGSSSTRTRFRQFFSLHPVVRAYFPCVGTKLSITAFRIMSGGKSPCARMKS